MQKGDEKNCLQPTAGKKKISEMPQRVSKVEKENPHGLKNSKKRCRPSPQESTEGEIKARYEKGEQKLKKSGEETSVPYTGYAPPSG